MYTPVKYNRLTTLMHCCLPKLQRAFSTLPCTAGKYRFFVAMSLCPPCSSLCKQVHLKTVGILILQKGILKKVIKRILKGYKKADERALKDGRG